MMRSSSFHSHPPTCKGSPVRVSSKKINYQAEPIGVVVNMRREGIIVPAIAVAFGVGLTFAFMRIPFTVQDTAIYVFVEAVLITLSTALFMGTIKAHREIMRRTDPLSLANNVESKVNALALMQLRANLWHYGLRLVVSLVFATGTAASALPQFAEPPLLQLVMLFVAAFFVRKVLWFASDVVATSRGIRALWVKLGIK